MAIHRMKPMTLAGRRLERKGEESRALARGKLAGKTPVADKRATLGWLCLPKERQTASLGVPGASAEFGEKLPGERKKLRSYPGRAATGIPDCSRRLKAPAQLAAALLFPLHVFWGMYNLPCDLKRNALVESR